MKNFLYRTLCGFFLGVSVIAPGVSGTVMAVMMGIYRDLIRIISNPFKDFKRNFFYLLPMGLGAAVSLALFVKLLDGLFESYPAQAQLLFMGLIAGSLFEVFKQVKTAVFKPRYLIGAAAALAASLVMSLLGRGGTAAAGGEIDLWLLCTAGAVSGAAAIIPGMSVSLVLMLFGVYDYLLKVAAAYTSDLWGTVLVAAPVGLCFLAVMVLSSKLIKLVFDSRPGLAYTMVFGFMCGTLAAVFPEDVPKSVGAAAFCVLMFAAGLGVSLGFQFMGNRFNPGKMP